MENLINGIQHFFVATFTTVVTVVMVALPFNKSPIQPPPPPKLEVQVKKEATPSINPSPTNQGTQRLPQPSTTPVAIPSPVVTLIDCIGPDGKSSRLTEKQCDDFNTAWNKSPVKGQNTTINPQPKNTNGYGNTSGNTNYNNSSNYPSYYIFPTYPPINSGNSQQAPTNTPDPVDNSLNLKICLSNAQNSYNSQMNDLNQRGMLYSGQADQVKSDYAAQQQSCHQQYGN